MISLRSRRTFLQRLAGGACVPFALSRFSPLLAATSSGEDYWQMVRRHFAFPEDKVPLNAANLCPSPRIVTDNIIDLTRDIDADCSSQNRAKFKHTLEESREKVANHLGVSADEIALVRNTSEGNNTVNNGLPLREGDEILLWDQNHPTNNVAWDVRAARFGFTVRKVATPRQPKDETQLLSTFEDAFTPRTRVLSLTHVSNVSGLQLPVREICNSAHRHNIYVHVDGAQSWGAMKLDLREMGCDSFAASAHKWLCGPREVGVLYVKREHISRIWPNTVAPGWGEDTEPDHQGARKFESLGQRDAGRLAAMGTIIDFHELVSADRIGVRVQELANLLKAALLELGAKLVTPMDTKLSHGVCIIDVPRANRSELVSRLYNEHGIAASATGGLRLCPHFYNTENHIQKAILGMRALARLIA